MRVNLIAECIGTALLVFVGCGLMVVNEISGGVIGHFGVSAGWGLVVSVLVFTFGDVSGAHINPAVSIGFAAAGRFAWREVPGYVAAQLIGAVGGAALLKVLFPAAKALGQTNPQGSLGQSFGLELAITAMLMLVIIRVATGAKEKGASAGLAIGFAVLVLALFAGPVSMASLNPARSFGPALVAGDFNALWIYLVAPVVGALLAVGLDKLLEKPQSS